MSKKLSKIILIVFILIIISFITAYFVTKKTEAYKIAHNFIISNKNLTDKIGEIKTVRLAFFGYMQEYKGPEGKAVFEFLVEGSKTNGSVYISLKKEVGIWRVPEANFVTDDSKSYPLINQ